MEHLSYPEWRRLKQFQVELGVIGVGFFVLVTILVCLLYKLSGQFSTDKLTQKLTQNPYLRFAYASFIKPHGGVKDGGQQSALESFYAAQVGRQVSHLL